MKIFPTIFTENQEEFNQMLSQCEGVVDHIQIDINDGTYLGGRTISLDHLAGLDTNLLIDYHLMVSEPINFVEKCVRAGADRIIAHIEHMSSQIDFVKKVQGVGCRVGLALDIDTEIENIDKVILKDLDVILLGDYKMGKPGQELNKVVLEKIKKLVEIKSGDPTPFAICCDGGINQHTIKNVADAGADEVVVGKGLFVGDIGDNISKLRNSL